MKACDRNMSNLSESEMLGGQLAHSLPTLHTANQIPETLGNITIKVLITGSNHA